MTGSRDELFRRFNVLQKPQPRYVVWELTLRCDQHCTHCGSRAGSARSTELSTDQALEVVKQLAALGTFECVLIGGEAYLHPGFLDVIRALRAHGVRPSMTTGGRNITPALARDMAEAGLHTVSVSIDGLEATHDAMRASKGSFAAATAALRALTAAGIRTASNINLNRFNQGDLEPLAEHLVALGISAWQVQLTAPLGRAADRAAMLLQPWDLLELMPRIAALKRRLWDDAHISLQPGNNLGYFGPEEALLRSPDANVGDHFQGCQAGQHVMGIESNGAVKGCPSLQSQYIGGNLTTQPLAEMWANAPKLQLTRRRTVDDLWGFCRTCPFASTCLGGCTFTAHAFFDRPGNNPYCHYRARSLAARGRRERLVPARRAPGAPFDNGTFELIEEPFDSVEPPLPGPKPTTWRLSARRYEAPGTAPAESSSTPQSSATTTE
ncbi:MAG: radical SAM protein [Archangium sp.]|nr:radical SAM protein [Archangium sp.]